MRPTRTLVCAVLALATSVGVALSSATASVRPTPPDQISEKGRLISDGVLTVNGTETVLVKKLPPKMKLRVEVTPPLTKSCLDPKAGICISAPIAPAPGAPAFRTNGKGRALLTFNVPDHYDRLNSKNLVDRTPVPFTNGQRVLVSASGIHREIRNGHKELIFAFARAPATVVTAPAAGPAPASPTY